MDLTEEINSLEKELHRLRRRPSSGFGGGIVFIALLILVCLLA